MSNPISGHPKREYWHPTNIIVPRKTIYGKWVRGKCFKRDVIDGPGGLLEGTLWSKQYATGKEVFEYKLKGKI